MCLRLHIAYKGLGSDNRLINPAQTGLRDDLIAGVLEFFGTLLFLLIGLGGIQASATSVNAANAGIKSTNNVAGLEQLLYISVSMGLGLLVSVWMFYRVTGGAFNPAVSLSLFLCGAIGPVRLVVYFFAQMSGAIAASAILLALLPGPLAVTSSLGASTSRSQGVFIEMFITAALCLCVLTLAVEKHKTTALAPVAIGLTLFVCHLWAVVYTGAGMNTARVFGPSVITGFNNDHWVYWVGPFLGALLATGIYVLLKKIDYERLNPGQDAACPEEHSNHILQRRQLTLDTEKLGSSTMPSPAIDTARRDTYLGEMQV